MHFKESHTSKEYTDNQCLTLSVDICIKQTEDILKKKVQCMLSFMRIKRVYNQHMLFVFLMRTNSLSVRH